MGLAQIACVLAVLLAAGTGAQAYAVPTPEQLELLRAERARVAAAIDLDRKAKLAEWATLDLREPARLVGALEARRRSAGVVLQARRQTVVAALAASSLAPRDVRVKLLLAELIRSAAAAAERRGTGGCRIGFGNPSARRGGDYRGAGGDYPGEGRRGACRCRRMLALRTAGVDRRAGSTGHDAPGPKTGDHARRGQSRRARAGCQTCALAGAFFGRSQKGLRSGSCPEIRSCCGVSPCRHEPSASWRPRQCLRHATCCPFRAR